MQKDFITFLILIVISLLLLVFFDFNLVHKWVYDNQCEINCIQDKPYFLAYYLTLSASIYLVSKRAKGKIEKAITKAIFYVTLSNIWDEILFDPTENSMWEWIFALITFIIIYHYQYVILSRSKKIRN